MRGRFYCCLLLSVLLAGTTFAAGPFKIIGYSPYWRGAPTTVQLQHLTHIVFSFSQPTAAGGLTVGMANLSQMVTAAHAQNVKAMLAIGGGGYGDGSFPAIVASASLRKTFVDACMAAVTTYSLDGLDIDWEYPDKGTQADGYALLMADLAAVLHPQGKLLSSAVTDNDWPGTFAVNSPVFQSVDYLNIMIYDMGNPHSPYARAVSSIATFITTKKLPKEKFILGVPFYANNPNVQTYSWIVNNYPNAPQKDGEGGYDYNSIPTIQQKTDLALAQAGGVMIWEIGQDAAGTASLLTAISNRVKSATGIVPGTISGSKPGIPVFSYGSGYLRIAFSDNVRQVPATVTVFGLNGRVILNRRLVPDASGTVSMAIPGIHGPCIVKIDHLSGIVSGKFILP